MLRVAVLVAAAALALACMAALPTVQAADWAIIVAGSATFDNYRHQSDACHAYQVVRKFGIPESNIITMMYDDVASDPSNPFPGQIFNAPTNAGTAGVNVYKNVKLDYTGENVTPENFLAIITGNSSAVTPAGSRVLQSTADDRVFINFVDHGGPGLIAFPTEYLYATDLIPALKQMYETKMYKKLVFYLEACESGSMFDGLLPAEWNMYATTAANPTESSWGTFCPPEDMVDGTEINSCLGDLYSVNWLQNAEQAGTSETLEAQFKIVQNLTDQSHVMQYGDLTFTSLPTGDFIGEGGLGMEMTEAEMDSSKPRSHVSSRDVPVHLAYYRYLRAPQFSAASKAALAALRAQLDAREQAETRFTLLSEMLSQDRHTGKQFHTPAHLFRTPASPVISGVCVKSAVKALKDNGCDYDDHSLQFHKVIVNACAQHAHEEEFAAWVVRQIETVCA